MSFKDFSYLELWRPFGLAEKTICIFFVSLFVVLLYVPSQQLWSLRDGNFFVRGHYQEQFCEIILYLGQWFRFRLKTFYLELWRPLYMAKPNHLCNFGRSHHAKKLCEIILNLN